MFKFIGFCQIYLILTLIMELINFFRMPYKSKERKRYRKDWHRTKVSSDCGSEKFIPNCPPQGKKEFIGIHGTLRRTRTYPEYSGRVSAFGSGRSGSIYKSASNDCINFPRFSKLKYGEHLPFVGCNKCTPWVICNEHQEWLTIPGHANCTPIFEANKSSFVRGDSSTPRCMASPHRLNKPFVKPHHPTGVEK